MIRNLWNTIDGGGNDNVSLEIQLRAGADPNAPSPVESAGEQARREGRLALTVCASRGNGEAVRLLLRYGAVVDAQDSGFDGPRTALNRCAMECSADSMPMMRLLLHYGHADPHQRDRQNDFTCRQWTEDDRTTHSVACTQLLISCDVLSELRTRHRMRHYWEELIQVTWHMRGLSELDLGGVIYTIWSKIHFCIFQYKETSLI